jgi:hypothetical protein
MAVGWQLTEQLAELVARGKADRATARAVEQLAWRAEGCAIDVDDHGCTIRLRRERGEEREGRGATLADALAALESARVADDWRGSPER